MRVPSPRTLLVASVLAASLAPATARADHQSDSVAARALFQDARKLVGQGKYNLACPKFEESLNLDPGIGTMFNLADCYEHVGRTASAWSRYLDAATTAKNAGQPEREAVAHKRAAALEPHLSRLTVTVPAPDAGLEVHDGDRAVAAGLFGEAVPVDPGPHTIEATAPGKKHWQSTIQVGADGAAVTVTVPALTDDPDAKKPVPPAEVAASPAPAPVPAAPPQPHDSHRTQRIVGWVTAGAGVVGVGLGAAFGITTLSKNNQAEGLCKTNNMCASSAEFNQHASLVNDAKTDRTASIIGFAAGGAALVGGVILIVATPKAEVGALYVTPSIGLNSLGAVVGADF